jgi:hypothetical protein
VRILTSFVENIYSIVGRENSVPELNWRADQWDVSADQQASQPDTQIIISQLHS